MKIENETVTNSIVVNKTQKAALKWALERFGGEWVVYDENNPGGVGATRDKETGRFIPLKEFESHIFDREKWEWLPPIPKPEGAFYWDEDSTSWLPKEDLTEG